MLKLRKPSDDIMAPHKRHRGSTYSSKRPKASAVPSATAADDYKRVLDGEEFEEISGGWRNTNDVPWYRSCDANDYGSVEVNFGGGLSLVLETPPGSRNNNQNKKDKRKGSK